MDRHNIIADKSNECENSMNHGPGHLKYMAPECLLSVSSVHPAISGKRA
jgi:hypothetical protein